VKYDTKANTARTLPHSILDLLQAQLYKRLTERSAALKAFASLHNVLPIYDV
jgi:hypothetical protein